MKKKRGSKRPRRGRRSERKRKMVKSYPVRESLSDWIARMGFEN